MGNEAVGAADPPAPPAADPWRPTTVLVAALILALAVRVATALLLPNQVWPDEVMQTLEPAHRLAFGEGVVTWEYREGIRNWVLPWLLSLPMRVFGAGSSTSYLATIAVLSSMLSLLAVVVAFSWGRHRAGNPAAVLGALLTAVWLDQVYFAPKALTEVFAGNLLLPGLALGLIGPRQSRYALVAGVLCGLAAALRAQLVPGVLVALCWMLARDPRRWWSLLLGAALAPGLFGIVDWFTWGSPFHSYLTSFQINALEGRAEDYGWLSPHYYLVYFWHTWTPIPFLLLAGLALLGTRREPALAAVIAVLGITHSLVGHKEYRFLQPVVPMVLVLAAIGAGMLAERCRRWHRLGDRLCVDALAAVLVAGSLVAAVDFTADKTPTGIGGPRLQTSLWRQGRDELLVMRDLSRRDDVGGVALVSMAWPWSGGYANLHQPVPLYVWDAEPPPVSAFNYAVVQGDLVPEELAGFERVALHGELRLLRRDGPCVPAPELRINRVLEDRGW